MEPPLDLQGLLSGTIAAAVVVLAGASYAFCYAMARLQQSRLLDLGALLSYLVLAAAAAKLATALSFSGLWLVVIAVMLAGYLLLPMAIWRLCVGTHGTPSNTVNDQGGM